MLTMLLGVVTVLPRSHRSIQNAHRIAAQRHVLSFFHVSHSFIGQIPVPQVRKLRIKTKSAELLGVVDIDGIDIGHAQCPFRSSYAFPSAIYSFLVCTLRD